MGLIRGEVTAVVVAVATHNLLTGIYTTTTPNPLISISISNSIIVILRPEL